jgi:hypothetical protein
MTNPKFSAATLTASIAKNDNRQAPHVVRTTPPVDGRTRYCKSKRPVLNADGTPKMELKIHNAQPSFAGLHDAERLEEAA